MPGVSGDYPVYGVPDPVENWAVAIAVVGALLALAFCVRHTLKNRSPLALFLFVGAGVTVFIEPFTNVLGKASLAEVGRVPWMGGLGRQVPMYVGLGYLIYLTPAYLVVLDAIRKGISARALMTAFFALVAFSYAFEAVPLHYDLWQYYGSQGIRIGEMPLWWGFINVHGAFGTAICLHFLLKLVPGKRQFLVIPLMPPLFLAVHTGGAMFGYLTVGTTTNDTVTTLGTLATCALCVALVRLYAYTVCRPPEAAGAVSASDTILSTVSTR